MHASRGYLRDHLLTCPRVTCCTATRVSKQVDCASLRDGPPDGSGLASAGLLVMCGLDAIEVRLGYLRAAGVMAWGIGVDWVVTLQGCGFFGTFASGANAQRFVGYGHACL